MHRSNNVVLSSHSASRLIVSAMAIACSHGCAPSSVRVENQIGCESQGQFIVTVRRLREQWRSDWTSSDDPKSEYSRKAAAASKLARNMTETDFIAVLQEFVEPATRLEAADLMHWMFDPMLEHLAQKNSTDGMVQLLSHECHEFVWFDVPIERWLVRDASRLGSPLAFQSLLKAYDRAADPVTQETIAAAVRAGWDSMGWESGLSDAELVARFLLWHKANGLDFKPSDGLSGPLFLRN